MEVRLLIGASAYACIVDGARSVDFLLAPGRSAAQSLRETAADLREQSARLESRADLAERAATFLVDGAAPPAALSDRAALNLIQAALNGQEWNADTCSEVANLVRQTTREIRDSE